VNDITNTTDTERGRTVEKESCFRSFHSRQNQGFQMVFSNGWMISVQFGAFAKSSPGFFRSLWDGIFECSNAEVFISNPEGDLVRPDGFGFSEDMKGFVKPDEVSSLIEWVSSR
jgi:hypothetical protein